MGPTHTTPDGLTGDPQALMKSIRIVLTDDLLKPEYRLRGDRRPTSGHCYAASEALYHLMGGKAAGLTPVQLHHEGDSHWYLRTSEGTYLDPTADQFATVPPHAHGTGRGFQTREPAKRTAEIIRRVNALHAALHAAPDTAPDTAAA
jgi:hypothetical protein